MQTFFRANIKKFLLFFDKKLGMQKSHFAYLINCTLCQGHFKKRITFLVDIFIKFLMDKSLLLYIHNTHLAIVLLTAIGIFRYYSNLSNHQL